MQLSGWPQLLTPAALDDAATALHLPQKSSDKVGSEKRWLGQALGDWVSVLSSAEC